MNATATPFVDTATSPASCGTTFILSAGSFAPWCLRVLSFRGREAASRPFRFDLAISVGSTDALDLESALLGQPATLSLQVPDGDPRRVCGIVAAVEAQDVFDQRQHAFHLRIVPRLWLLGKRKTSRVFQNETVPEIVGAVLDAARVPHRATLTGRYLARAHCVQYQETDLAFVTQLLAEEGIFYCFEHGTEETVVLCDSACIYEPIADDPQLAYRSEQDGDGLVRGEHHVGRFALRRTIKPGAVLHRDYDFRRPVLDLRAEAKSSSPSRDAAAEDALPFETQQLRVYDHHGDDEQPSVDGGTAQVRLEQHRRRAVVARGASVCRRLMPGRRFELIDHEIDALNRSYVVARVEHEGRAPEVARGREPVYANTFTCVPADVALRPKRPERVLRQVTETALVVGPEGEEIHTDTYGRVKVQFPWDLEGKKNERSSCWVRVSQGWAGAGWGLQLIPRIGMEVVVTFVGGDVDRPLITGCVPNAANAPAFALPANRTRSGIRTRTLPGGSGFNELSFEDRRGAEQVHLHAARDLDEVVERNHTRLVKADENVTVQRDRRETVLGDQTTQVHGCRAEAVLGGRASTVEGDSREAVTGNAELRVSEDLTTRVGGRERREVSGASDFAAKEDVNVRVRGCHTTLVGTRKEERSYVLHVEGLTQLTSSGITEIRSDKALVLSCGRSSLRITDGKIEIISPAISMSGAGGGLSIDEDTIRLRAKKDVQIVAEHVLLKTPDASVSLAKDAQIDGRRVLLNSPDSATDPPLLKQAKPTKITLVDQRGKPLAHRRYLVTLGDGSEVSGILDKNGKAEVEIDGTGTITFPGLRGTKAA